MTTEEIDDIVKQALKRAYQYFLDNDPANAEEIYRQILRVSPENTEAIQMLILVAVKNCLYDEAIEIGTYGISIDPTNHQIWNNLGLAYGSINNHSEAIRCFRTAIECKPESHLYTNLAIEYKKAGDLDMAKEIFHEAILQDPKSEHTWFNTGAFYHELGNLEDAIVFYNEAIAISDLAAAHYNLSACYFLLNDYEKGWSEYEWRWTRHEHFAAVRDKHSGAYWDGRATKDITLYCEQGIGDSIMFARYIEMVKPLVENIFLECDESIKPLYDGLGVNTCTVAPPTEYHCSLLSLPYVLKAGIPAPTKLVNVLPKNDDFWGLFSGCKVGIAWAGNPIHPNDLNRSTNLGMFMPLYKVPGVKLFSLQKESLLRCDGSDPNIGSALLRAVDLREHMTDWACTAAIIDNLDLVISIDTAVAHLAASLGKEVWLLLPQLPDWRWGMTGETTPWYPTMRLFRADSSGYYGVIQRVAEQLANFCHMTIPGEENAAL